MGNSGITMHVGRELKTDRQLHETVLVSVRNHKVQRNRVREVHSPWLVNLLGYIWKGKHKWYCTGLLIRSSA